MKGENTEKQFGIKMVLSLDSGANLDLHFNNILWPRGLLASLFTPQFLICKMELAILILLT